VTAPRRSALLCALILMAMACLAPAIADAHGILGRAYLPVPAWVFAWAAGIVLVASFAALSRLWSAPRLEHPAPRVLLRIPGFAVPLCGAIGVAAFGLVVVAGLAGSQTPLDNLAPTAVFVVFWVGFPVASALLGDVFAAFNPWRGVARAIGWVLRGRTGRPLPYPEWLGRWPAAGSILAFGWLELVYVDRQHPATLAVLAVGYALVQLVGMAAFGIDVWGERADGFAVAFNLYSRLSPLVVTDGVLRLRPPLAGLSALAPMAGTVGLLCAMIGTTTFDGAANGSVWKDASKPLTRGLGHLGLSSTPSIEIAYTLGLLLCVGLCAGLYVLGVRGMAAGSAEPHPPRALAQAFVHSLAPIALGYLVAHYFSLLVTQGQAAVYLISDPLGRGADLLGTASFHVNYKLFSTTSIWYVQVAALVAGHVAGLASAHDRALVVYVDPEEAAISQRWMLVVMVTFTSLGLWLLSAVYT
jgi:hypothetical protein